MRDGLKYLLVVAIAAIVGYLIWHQRFSKEAKVDVAFNTCLKQFNPPSPKANADGTAPAGGNDAAAALARGMDDAVVALRQGLGSAVCGSVKDTCTQDFNGSVCQAALNRFK
jgi:hypothetical protein